MKNTCANTVTVSVASPDGNTREVTVRLDSRAPLTRRGAQRILRARGGDWRDVVVVRVDTMIHA